ncbi:MAG: YfiR family protein [Pseudomonadota bacterium]
MMALSTIFINWQVAAALSALPIAVQSDIPSTPDGPAIATAEMVTSIISYSRWDNSPQTIRLCVTGTSATVGRIESQRLRDGRNIVVVHLAPSAASPTSCEVIYIGQMAPPDRARLINRLGNSTLTLTDADPNCDYGAAFCLHSTSQGLTFDLNIDAVARSRIRVDPRVLRLGRLGGSQR